MKISVTSTDIKLMIILKAILFSENIKRIDNKREAIPDQYLEFIYNSYSETIFASLAIQDRISITWDVLVLFMALLPPKAVTKVRNF
jgi:hypothetical protein